MPVHVGQIVVLFPTVAVTDDPTKFSKIISTLQSQFSKT